MGCNYIAFRSSQFAEAMRRFRSCLLCATPCLRVSLLWKLRCRVGLPHRGRLPACEKGRDQVRATLTERTKEGRALSRRDRRVFLAKGLNLAPLGIAGAGFERYAFESISSQVTQYDIRAQLGSQEDGHLDGGGVASGNQGVFHQHVAHRPGCARSTIHDNVSESVLEPFGCQVYLDHRQGGSGGSIPRLSPEPTAAELTLAKTRPDFTSRTWMKPAAFASRKIGRAVSAIASSEAEYCVAVGCCAKAATA